MKHYILVWIEVPSDAPMNASERAKLDFWHNLKPLLAHRAKSIEGISELAENVWLLPQDSALPFVAMCIGAESMPLLKVHTKFLHENP